MDQDGDKQCIALLFDRDQFTCRKQMRTDCKYRFAVTEIADLLYKTYLARTPAEFDSIGSAHLVFRRLEVEFLSTSPEVQTKIIEDAKMIIRRRQRWIAVVEVNASMPYND
ncbi:hypothetical protein K440DRAFT_643987 [Wilcoxina mikolae CBS 423.85]|nr:hypothetical protein K440DRAFT_643987 [Wilcoxina mikolae CBS 423.85]